MNSLEALFIPLPPSPPTLDRLDFLSVHVDLLHSNHSELVVARCHRITRMLENICNIQDQLESFISIPCTLAQLFDRK